MSARWTEDVDFVPFPYPDVPVHIPEFVERDDALGFVTDIHDHVGVRHVEDRPGDDVPLHQVGLVLVEEGFEFGGFLLGNLRRRAVLGRCGSVARGAGRFRDFGSAVSLTRGRFDRFDRGPGRFPGDHRGRLLRGYLTTDRHRGRSFVRFGHTLSH